MNAAKAIGLAKPISVPEVEKRPTNAESTVNTFVKSGVEAFCGKGSIVS